MEFLKPPARQPAQPYCKIKNDGRESSRSFHSGFPQARVDFENIVHQHPPQPADCAAQKSNY
jgi:hypothetical protein